MRNQQSRRLVHLALLTAIGVLLVYLVRFPLFPAAASYLEYDMGDVPILIGTFLYGPWWGLLLTVAVSVLQGLTVSAASGPVGVVMHICATGLFAVAAGLIYKRRRTRDGAVMALIAGSIAQILIMIPLNLTLTVYYNGVPAEVVMSLIWPIIVPFNAFKVAVNSAFTLLLYKQAGKLLRLER